MTSVSGGTPLPSRAPFWLPRNGLKSWLITKPALQSEAERLFDGTGVSISTSGRPHLGAPLGSQSFVEEFMSGKVSHWCEMLSMLSQFAVSHPQAAYATYTHGFISMWTFLCRTLSSACQFLQPLEDSLRHNLIPSLTGRGTPGDLERRLLALPTRLGPPLRLATCSLAH